MTLQLVGAHGVRDALRLRIALGHSHRCNLRVAVRASRNRRVIHAERVMTLHAFHARDGFFARHVCEPRRADDITDCIHARNRRLIRRLFFILVIRPQVILLHAHAELRVEESIEATLHTDGDEHGIAIDRLHLRLVLRTRDGDSCAASRLLLDFRGRMREEEVHALLRERLECRFRDVIIFHRKNPIKHFNDSHLRAKRVEEVRELHADRA